MPTLAGDVAAVLADEKVHFQMQEVAVVIAEDRYAAADGVEAVLVEYDELPVVIDPFEALKPGAPVLREDLAGKTEGAHGKRDHHNHIFTWEAGDKAAADAAFANAPVKVAERIFYPRVHPCPLETCGCVASFDPVRGELTTYMTSQAPHVVRTVVSLLSGLPESKIRIVSPDIGGGFGNKVGVYPGYVCAIVASIVLGKPVKWIEDRIENISSTAFARDYHMDGEIAATKDGKIIGLRVNVIADHGAFDACADPTKYPAGMFHICSGAYDIPAAYCNVKGVYTNKAPGGVAYRCSFRVTEAVYVIERLVDILAQQLGMDKAEIREKNFIKKEQFPYTSAFGFEYDSGDYHTALKKVLDACDYKGLRDEQAKKRADKDCPTLMGIGLVSFTEVVGAGPSKMCDILGVGMFDSCEIRVHPTGSAIARMGTISQGQGHQTTYAQIIATELGIPSEVIQVEEGDTSTAPYGLGTYGSRSTPVAGAAIAMAARKIHAKARKIAAHLLEVGEADLDWEIDRFKVKGDGLCRAVPAVCRSARSRSRSRVANAARDRARCARCALAGRSARSARARRLRGARLVRRRASSRRARRWQPSRAARGAAPAHARGPEIRHPARGRRRGSSRRIRRLGLTGSSGRSSVFVRDVRRGGGVCVGRAGRRQQVFDQAAHALPVRPFPEDTAAFGAGAEPLVLRRHARRQFRQRLGPGDRLQCRIAAQAARERACAARKIEAGEDLAQLRPAAQCAHEAAVRDATALEQVTVARQHDAALRDCDQLDLSVVEAVVIKGVVTHHAQQVRQPAEVSVGDESAVAQRPRAQAQQRRHVEGLEHRVDRHPVVVGEQAVEAYRLAVDQDQLDLGVRHAERLDHVLRRCGPRAARAELVPAPVGREKVVQLLVEAEVGDDHVLHLLKTAA